MTSSSGPRGGSFIKQWLTKLIARFLPNEPENQEQLVQTLKDAKSRNLLGADTLSMMEGALQVTELRVRDIMVPRASMTVIHRDDELSEILPVLIDSAHSRFPVIDDDKSEVIGILLAKDLLKYCGESGRFNIRDVLRSAVFVPESKRLNVLLKEFRQSRNHMAIVVDEYGQAAGLVTIEDVLEQIVGEIEDEYDFDEGAYIFKRGDNSFTLKAHTRIDEFNEYFSANLDAGDFDTIGGLVVHAFGHLPRKDETVALEGFVFRVLRADSRKVHLLSVERAR